MTSCDVLIIGAGIAGASLAYRLALAGRAVVVVERESQPGSHATGRSAAMFMESYGPPGVRALTRASRAFYLDPPAGFAAEPLLHPRRALFVATPAQADALAALHAALADSGSPVSLLNREQLTQAAPALKADLFDNALLDEHGYDIDVHALLQGFLRGARQAGAEVRTGVVPTAATRGGARWRVALSSGDALTADIVVNAAGAWADEVARLFGAAPIGLTPRRRSAFTFRAPAGVDVSGWPMVCDVEEQWYFKPDAGVLLGSPANADDTHAHDVLPEDLDVALGIDRLQHATTLAITRPIATWAGLRTFAPDGEIVIGFDGAAPGFFWLAAQGGYGIQSAAGASELAAALIAQAPLPQSLARHGVNAERMSPARLQRPA